MTPKSDKGLYLGGICFITDRGLCTYSCSKMTDLALKSGIKWVQFRDKKMSRLELYREALELRKLTREHDAFLIVNDYADIAAAVDADGVHLGQEDLPVAEARKVLGSGKIIGVSTHSEAEALRAQEEGADYIGFGPVFHTETKDAGKPRGKDQLSAVSEKVSIPVVAIGGIAEESLEEVMSSGAKAVAVASAILKGDLNTNAGSFLRRLGKITNKSSH